MRGDYSHRFDNRARAAINGLADGPAFGAPTQCANTRDGLATRTAMNGAHDVLSTRLELPTVMAQHSHHAFPCRNLSTQTATLGEK
jgi:hypothetical protein